MWLIYTHLGLKVKTTFMRFFNVCISSTQLQLYPAKPLMQTMAPKALVSQSDREDHCASKGLKRTQVVTHTLGGHTHTRTHTHI